MRFKTLIAVFLLWPVFAFAQKVKVQVNGTVFEYNIEEDRSHLLPEANVNVSDGTNSTDFTASAGGAYELDLAYDKLYTITYSKPGFITKYIEIDTRNIPEKEQRKGDFILPIDMELYKENPEIELGFLQNTPITKYSYNPNSDGVGKGHLDYDKKKSDQVFSQIIDAIDALKKDDDYYEAMRMAREAMDERDYRLAKSLYEKALFHKPNDPIATEELEAMPYNKAIAVADDKYNVRALRAARPLYVNASNIDPTKRYPKDRIREIDAILSAIKKKQNNNLISAWFPNGPTVTDPSDEYDPNEEPTDNQTTEPTGELTADNAAAMLAAQQEQCSVTESFEEKRNKKITTRLVTDYKGVVQKYLKVEAVYGTYYFRDGVNIPKHLWDETESCDAP